MGLKTVHATFSPRSLDGYYLDDRHTGYTPAFASRGRDGGGLHLLAGTPHRGNSYPTVLLSG